MSSCSVKHLNKSYLPSARFMTAKTFLGRVDLKCKYMEGRKQSSGEAMKLQSFHDGLLSKQCDQLCT